MLKIHKSLKIDGEGSRPEMWSCIFWSSVFSMCLVSFVFTVGFFVSRGGPTFFALAAVAAGGGAEGAGIAGSSAKYCDVIKFDQIQLISTTDARLVIAIIACTTIVSSLINTIAGIDYT